MNLVDWQQRFEHWILTHHAQEDAAHDLSHFRRVWATATRLAAGEVEVDRLVLLTACYFHDIVSLPKNHPERSRSSMMAAEKTLAILQSSFTDFPADRYAAVCHAIEAHSFSAAIPPRTLEAKIVQDADRLESLGAIGLARVFAVAGALNTILFDADDPFADRRALDDRKYALDHFQCKLLRLPETMQTAAGRAMAQHNARFLVEFMAKISAELKGEPMTLDEAVLRRFAPQPSTDQ
ncbi:phosphohydrolase [Klebsiella quasipneumoniae]|uniref:phosphohydrolase n=1 Tax=Klebsiella quasipneumoniae TaxID=1463165 RepID=UPI0010347C16|nr:phosphohydrolase [Klebsiella quasipneumoniae]